MKSNLIFPSIEEKVDIVVDYNTLFYYNEQSEEQYESYIQSLLYRSLDLQEEIKDDTNIKDAFENLLQEDNGITILLAVTSISFEDLLKYIDIISTVKDNDVIEMTHRDMWHSDGKVTDWTKSKIQKLLKTNQYFRKCIMNLIYDANKNPFFKRIIPQFKLEKFSRIKMEEFSVIPSSALDTMIRYKEGGSYSGSKENNAENIISSAISDIGWKYETGDLEKLHEIKQTNKRTMDFMCPDRKNPSVIIESSFVTTTSSGLGDKAKAEISMRENIKKHYPNAHFFGIIDGIGWRRRKTDLSRMVEAFDDVFTLHPEQINRLKTLLTQIKND
jgi:hypothetical protein